MIISPVVVQRFYDNNGGAFIGGQVFTYLAGTTTKTSTWKDPGGISLNTNPIITDFRGEARICLDSSLTYKFVVAPATDTDPPTNPIWSFDNIRPSLDSSSIILSTQIKYPQTAAEIAAAVVPTNLFYPEGNLKRYGALINGAADDATAINNAIKVARAGSGYIWHPGGNCIHASQILSAGGYSVLGGDPLACFFTYTGAAGVSAWRITNNGTSAPTPNTSGFGRWYIDGVTITTAIASSTAAALEINACGYAFYQILPRTVIAGTFKYGVILDGVEVAHVHRGVRIENGGPSGAANIWLTNGPDRVATQSQGFTNDVTIEGCQLNVSGASSFSILDDGGSNHSFVSNNCNGAHTPIRVAGAIGLVIQNNEIENALAGAATGSANILFTDTAGVSATSVGPCIGFVVSGGNVLGADMVAGSSSLKFSGSTMHQGGKIFGNWFRNNGGRSADIDVTKLSNSDCCNNYGPTAVSGSHYTATHNDANGNNLSPPQNGFGGAFAEAAYVCGDTRYPFQYFGGIDAKTNGANGLSLDAQKWQNFNLRLTNTAGVIQHAIFDNALQGGSPGYADRIIGNSTALANTPSVAAGVAFTNGVGLLSGTTSHVVLSTAAAVSGKSNLTVTLVYYDGNVTRLNVYIGLASRNVNSVTQFRPELVFTNDMTGAAVNIDTTLLPAGKILDININGYIA